jgi:hypothetical protein
MALLWTRHIICGHEYLARTKLSKAFIAVKMLLFIVLFPCSIFCFPLPPKLPFPINIPLLFRYFCDSKLEALSEIGYTTFLPKIELFRMWEFRKILNICSPHFWLVQLEWKRAVHINIHSPDPLSLIYDFGKLLAIVLLTLWSMELFWTVL